MNSHIKIVPIRAKPFSYNTNGTGRDTYIHVNNGGLSVSNQNFSTLETQNSYVADENIRQKTNQSPFQRGYSNGNASPTKMNYYRNDGTGRDNYIKVDNGGQSHTGIFVHNQTYFKNSLRRYEKLERSPKQNGNSKQILSFLSNKSQTQNLRDKIQLKIQKEHCSQLSQPKWIKVNPLQKSESAANIFSATTQEPKGFQKSKGVKYQMQLPFSTLEGKKRESVDQSPLNKEQLYQIQHITQNGQQYSEQISPTQLKKSYSHAKNLQLPLINENGQKPQLPKSQSVEGKMNKFVLDQIQKKQQQIVQKKKQNNIVSTLGQFTERSHIRKQQYQNTFSNNHQRLQTIY